VLFHYFGMFQVRENEMSLRNSSGGPEYLRTHREHCWGCNGSVVNKSLYPFYTTNEILMLR